MLAQALTALLVLEDQVMRTALEEFLSGRSVSTLLLLFIIIFPTLYVILHLNNMLY